MEQQDRNAEKKDWHNKPKSSPSCSTERPLEKHQHKRRNAKNEIQEVQWWHPKNSICCTGGVEVMEDDQFDKHANEDVGTKPSYLFGRSRPLHYRNGCRQTRDKGDDVPEWDHPKEMKEIGCAHLSLPND